MSERSDALVEPVAQIPTTAPPGGDWSDVPTSKWASDVADAWIGPRIRDVMTADVIVAFADTRSFDVAELMVALRLNAVPVTDLYDHVIGVVSTADLPLSELLASARSRSSRWRWRWGRTSTSTVGELMTSPAVTVAADAPVARAARLMVDHRVKLLPVTDREAKLAGVVTCRDLLSLVARPDADIEAEIRTDVLGRYLPSVAAAIRLDVTDAVVTLSGYVPATGMVPLATHLVRRVYGVVDVVNDITTRP